MREALMQVFGVVGAVLTLTAYGALTKKTWTAESRRYLYVNLAATVLLLTVAIHARQYGYILLNALWGVFTLRALLVRSGW